MPFAGMSEPPAGDRNLPYNVHITSKERRW